MSSFSSLNSIRSGSKKIRRGFTLIELLISILIAVPLIASLFAAFLYILRIQATVADQSFVRINTDNAIQRLQQDIRNTSSGLYNSGAWQSLNPLQGGAGNENADRMVLQLLDSANGQRITWTFYRTPQDFDTGVKTIDADTGLEVAVTRKAVNVLSRSVLDETVPGATPVVTNYINMPYSDLVFDEVRLQEYIPTSAAPGAQLLLSDGSLVDDENSAGPGVSQVVAIEIKGRTLHRLTTNNTIIKEIDGDNDGDLRNDKVGAALFGRTNEGDDPKWQYIYNVTTTLRNS